MTNVKQNKEQPSIWDKVEDDLHSKVSIADAWQMAQNLGTHIAENCGDLTPQKMIRKTFVDAFGEDIGESKIKNRTRWVVLPKEVQGRVLNDLKANQLARSGGDLKQLAKALKPFRASYLELLVKGTSMEPSYLKVAVTDHTGFDLIEAICKSISEKYNLVDYYRTLISYDIGWKQFNPNVTDAQTMNRALSRFNLDSDINSQAYLDSRPAEVKKYLWPVGFSITDKSSAYGRLDETLHLITDGMYFDVLALAPTIFLGELHLPIPIFKVKLPK